MPKKKKQHQLANDLKHLRVITKKELSMLVPFSMQYIGTLERKGLFPKRIQIGENRVGWYLVEVEEWILSRSRGPVSPPHSRIAP